MTAQTMVDPAGAWTYTPIAPLGRGPHTVSATQTLNGATSAQSAENGFTVVVDTPRRRPRR